MKSWITKRVGSTLILAAVVSTPNHSFAESYSRPKVVARSQATVKGAGITLGDIAQITTSSPEQGELLTRLRGVPLGESPAPLTKTTLLAPNILAAIESAGVGLDTIGYSIPNTVIVERAGREVLPEEVLSAVRNDVSRDPDLDVQVREVTWQSKQIVPVGPTTVRVERLGKPQGGKIPIRVDVIVEQLAAARFLATAMVDDWREVPVLSKTLQRGMLIQPEDIQLVRLNLHKQPEDVAENASVVVGRRVLSTIQAGETIRKKLVEIPPMIERGKSVIVSFSSGALNATAKGTALEDGIEGSIIKIKNDASGKTIRGIVRTPSSVEVVLQ